MLHHSMFIFDFNSIFALILLLGLGKPKNSLVWGTSPLLTPWLCCKIFGCLEPCDGWDWVTNNVDGTKYILHHSLAKEKSRSSSNRPTNSPQQRARMYFVPSTLLVTQSQPSHGSRHPKILQQSQGVSSGLVPQTRLFLGF